MNKKIFRVFVFAGIFIFIFLGLEKILIEKWIYKPAGNEGETNRYKSFYELEPDTLDYLVFGASHSFFSINPMLIYAQEGYSGYDLGSPAQTIELSYYWLKEACKYQSPKYIFYDVGSLFYETSDKDKGAVIKGLAYMKPSLNKLEAACECKLPEMSVIELLSPMYVFHTRWKELTREYFNVNDYYYPYKGSYLTFIKRKITSKESSDKNDMLVYSDGVFIRESKGITAQNEEWFDKLFLLCQEQGIILVPVKCPTMFWDEGRNETVSHLLNRYGLKLLDMNTEDVKIDWDLDTPDTGKHTNYWGNCKASFYLRNFLKEKHNLKDHRGMSGYELWDRDLVEYKEFEKERLWSNEEKVLRHLQIIEKNKENLCLIICGKDDMCSNWNQSIDSHIKRLGLKSDFYNNIQNSYIGIVDSGEVVLDSFAEAPLKAELTLHFQNKESVFMQVESGGIIYGNVSKVLIEGEDFSLNNRGINIIALDRDKGKVVSSVSVDTWSEDWTYKEKIWDVEIWNAYLENGDRLIEDGIYTVSPIDKETLALDIPAGKSESGLALHLWGINSDLPQQFGFTYCEDGLYTIQCICSGKYLTAESYGNTCGTGITQEEYTGLSNQKWFIYENRNGYTIMNHYNHLVIDITGREAVEGLKLQMYENLNESWQQFSLKRV